MKRKFVVLRSFLSQHFTFSKRQQMVGSTILLTLSLISTQIFSGGLRLDILLSLSLGAYILSALVLREDLRGWEFLTLLILPTMYTGSVFVFYFLLPERWLTRLPIAILYALGMYAILLTENIYNVAAVRTIQLLRAAHSVGFLLTLLTAFFLLDTVYSLHLPFYFDVLLTLVVIFPLTLQSLWSMELTPNISTNVWVSTGVISLILTQFSLAFSFWPISSTIEALFITTSFYAFVGMTQQYLVERLFPKTSREFISVFILVWILVLATTRWGSGM